MDHVITVGDLFKIAIIMGGLSLVLAGIIYLLDRLGGE